MLFATGIVRMCLCSVCTVHVIVWIFYLGREARTYGLGLDQANVALDARSGKIIVDQSDATSAGHIFAIGDAINVSVQIRHACMCVYVYCPWPVQQFA